MSSCRNGRWTSLLVIVAATGMAATAALGESLPVQLGAPIGTVLATLGAPTRTIETGEGKIFFYGATLLFVTNGCVSFVSVANSSGVLVSAALIAPEAPPPAPALMVLPADAPPAASRQPLDSQQQRLMTRVRQFAATKAYASLCRDFLRALPLDQTDDLVGLRDARGHALPAFGNHANGEWYTRGVEINQFVLSN